MAEMVFEVRYRTDNDKPSDADIDEMARRIACSLYQAGGDRYSVFQEGRHLLFDPSDSGRWSRSVPADWDPKTAPKPRARRVREKKT